MTYTINQNKQFNSIEIAFDCKPSEAVRTALKELKFRWHRVKKVWYGYTDEETAKKAIEAAENEIDNSKDPNPYKCEPIKTNKYGVQVGDIFTASWGYEQTNNDFFQVVELIGKTSVRVREVALPMINESPACSMAADRTYKINRQILPPISGIFIKDTERGDVKRLKSYAADGVSNPVFRLSSFADAHLCTGDSITVYESWYY